MFGLRKQVDISSGIEEKVVKTVERLVGNALSKTESVLASLHERADLLDEVEKLKIEKMRREEEFAKREREIQHKVGLERERQKQEVELGKREAKLDAQQEALSADKKRFEGQMEFHEKRFTEEVGYLKEMIGQLAKRLPTAEVKVTRRG